MPEATDRTAEAQLGRILYTLAVARTEEGIRIKELAARLGVSPETIRDDVAQVTGREYYHPAASVMEMTILLERDRISVPLAGDFRRPMRLTPREAGALGLALRARAAETASPYREELLELAVALEKALTAPPPRRHGTSESEEGRRARKPARPSLATAVEIDPGDGARPGIRLQLEQAIAARRPVRIRYLKPGDAEPSARLIHPYALATAEGAWYAISLSVEAEGIRLFRLDRVLDVEALAGSFDLPPGFDPTEYTVGGRAFHAVDESEVVVRYSPVVAAWVLENHGPDATACADGSVVVRHRVADERWLVRLVLGFGGEAVVERPEAMKAAVARAAEAIAAVAD